MGGVQKEAVQAMSHHDICERLGQATHGVSRRAALGALAAYALLRGAPEDVAAKSKKQSKRARASVLKPISIRVYNESIDTPFTVSHGDGVLGNCCRPITNVSVPPGQSRVFRSRSNLAYIHIDEFYFIRLENPPFQRPALSVAWAGRFCCLGQPSNVVADERPLSVGDEHTMWVYDRDMSVRRQRDTNYKEFVIRVFKQIGPPAPASPAAGEP